MTQDLTPDPARLKAARNQVQSYLGKKKRFTTVLFVLGGVFETLFLAAMLMFMDFSDRFHWFLFFGFLFVYTPLVIMTWRNAWMIDRLYYRLVDELKYGDMP